MGLSLIILLILPYLYNSKIKGSVFSPIYKLGVWIFLINAVFLGWVGQKSMASPYQELGLFATIVYFAFFLIPLVLSLFNPLNSKS